MHSKNISTIWEKISTESSILKSAPASTTIHLVTFRKSSSTKIAKSKLSKKMHTKLFMSRCSIWTKSGRPRRNWRNRSCDRKGRNNSKNKIQRYSSSSSRWWSLSSRAWWRKERRRETQLSDIRRKKSTIPSRSRYGIPTDSNSIWFCPKLSFFSISLILSLARLKYLALKTSCAEILCLLSLGARLTYKTCKPKHCLNFLGSRKAKSL